jgi:hypothetical protein
MNNFTFDEYQMTQIELPILTQRGKGNTFRTFTEESRNQGIAGLCFLKDGEGIAEPSQEQLNALRYILEHQQELIEALYEYTKTVLYPVHIGYIGFDENSFPEINSFDDLYKTLGIDTVYIFPESKNDISYVSLYFEFTGDFEHGVYIVLHKSRILGWEEDTDNKKVIEDLQA